MNTQKHSKRVAVLFVYAIGGCLIAFVAAYTLTPAVNELYSGVQVMPFTTHIWWQFLPWLAVAVLSVDYCVALRCQDKEESTKIHVLMYCVSLVLTLFFIALTFWPLIVLL